MSTGALTAVLIAGPTASGKSALAIKWAQATGGLIINADSMQVYRDLHVLSARPSDAEMALAPHCLFGDVDGQVNFSVGMWLAAVAPLLAEAQAERRPVFLVGGTGLYFKALTQGLSDIPPVPEAIRAQVRARAEGRTPQSLHAELGQQDPLTAARLRPSDPQRILRALEVFAATGRPLASFQNARTAPLLAPGSWRGIFLAPEREALRKAIDARFLAMMAAGALDEVAALAARALDPMSPVMRAHGVPGLIAHLKGEASLEEAIARGQGDTRAYSKRQFTFARHQLPDFVWLSPAEAQNSRIYQAGF
jgi:tRNA dimethylallyltransferase